MTETEKRRALIAFCMDTLIRAIGDEDLMPEWLQYGVPDGSFDNVPNDALDKIAEAYAETWGDEPGDWRSLESLFVFLLLHGVWENAGFIDGLVYPNYAVFT